MKRGKFSYSTRRKIVIAIAFAIFALLFLFKNLNFLILASSAVAFILLFHLIDSLFDLRFKARHYLMIIFIAVASFLLWELYSLYPTYDKTLHFLQPLLVSSVIFHMLNGLDIKLNQKLIFTFFIVIGFVGLFEIAEYTLDVFFNLSLQGVVLRDIQEFGEELILIQEPLDDTMIDMSLGVLGAFVYIFYRKFLYTKSHSSKSI